MFCRIKNSKKGYPRNVKIRGKYYKILAVYYDGIFDELLSQNIETKELVRFQVKRI